jgi:hypothetical protein
VSTGQLFIEEAVEQEIMAMEPYASHTTLERVKNDADGTFRMESGSKFPGLYTSQFSC